MRKATQKYVSEEVGVGPRALCFCEPDKFCFSSGNQFLSFLLTFILQCKCLWSDARSSLRGMFPSHNHILTSSLALTDILHLPCSRFTVQNVYRNLRPYGSSQISLKFITNAPQQFALASHVLRIFWRRSIASGAYGLFVLRPRQPLKKLQTIHVYQPMMNQAKLVSPTLRSY